MQHMVQLFRDEVAVVKVLGWKKCVQGEEEHKRVCVARLEGRPFEPARVHDSIHFKLRC